MDSRLVVLLVITVAASGCGQKSQGTGVKIQSLSASDTSLNPGQEFSVEAQIVNYNQAPTTVKAGNIRLYNLGQLKKVSGSKGCNPDSIGASKENFNPRMVCTWVLKAPGKQFVKGFKSKPLSFKMGLEYSSTLENREPLKIDFQKMSKISQSNEIKRTFSNGDITATVTAQTPVALGNPQNLEIKVKNTGPGYVVGKYRVDFSHENLVNCPSKGNRKPIQGTARLSCTLNADSAGSRNLFISISYKYEKTPNVDIKVVNN
ncbi:MAG: hypothetical protein ABEK16_00915 [Candidatus Nanohalobium sp.]